jgi:hypothetical protein
VTRPDNGHPPAACWADRAGNLAGWAWERLVNRADVWGAYTPPERRGHGYVRPDGTAAKVPANYTAPSPARHGRVLLTQEVLARHFRGRRHEDVVGLHSTSPENGSRWAGVDIDWHGDGSNAPEVNLAAALGWFVRLTRLGFRPLLTDSNGKGGFHLLALFAEPVPTPKVFAFLRWLVADFGTYGLAGPPEVFPKQPRLDAGRYGNWLRLPGRHHSREHWSRAWDGSRWLEGSACVDYLLGLRGDSAALVPAVAPLPPPPRTATARVMPAGDGDALAKRVVSYMAKLPNLGEGQGRDDIAYNFAAFLVRDLALADEAALWWLGEWDRGNRPPKGEDRLREILASAHEYGRRPYGCGLDRPPPSRGHKHVRHLRFTVEV